MHRIGQTLARLTSRSSKRLTRDSNSPASDKPLDIARTLPRVGTAHTSTSDGSTATLFSDLHLDDRDSNRGCCFLHGHDQASPEGADIVFVHGLNGHRVRSWEKGDVCWPRDLLGGDMPEARVISVNRDCPARHRGVHRWEATLTLDPSGDTRSVRDSTTIWISWPSSPASATSCWTTSSVCTRNTAAKPGRSSLWATDMAA